MSELLDNFIANGGFELPNSLDTRKQFLEQRANTKREKLGMPQAGLSFEANDMIIGLNDADSIITEAFGGTRSASTNPNIRYDAVEIPHGEHEYDMVGKTKAERFRDGFGKSTYSLKMQRRQVARLFNKSFEDVTEADMIGVGNQQQIQKLADLTRSKGEERWIAPLFSSKEAINLTGKYKNEFGRDVLAPLNIPVHTVATGEKAYKREMVSFVNPNTNINVTDEAAVDMKLNAFTPGPKIEGWIPTPEDHSTITASDGVDGVKTFGTTIASTVPQLANMVLEAGVLANHWLGDPASIENMSDTELRNSTSGWLLGLQHAEDGTIESTIFDNGKDILDEYVGIDKERRDGAQKAIVDGAFNIYEDENKTGFEKVGELFTLLSDNVSTLPTSLGAVYGFMKQMALGGGTTLMTVAQGSKAEKVAKFFSISDGAKVADRVLKAQKATTMGLKRSDDAAAIAQKAALWATKNPKDAKKLASTILGLEKRFAGRSGITAAGIPLVAITTTEILEERHANNENDGTDNYSSPFEIIVTSILAYGMNAIDLVTDKFALSPHASGMMTGIVKTFGKEVAEATTQLSAKKALLASMGFVATSTGKIAESVIVEGATEGIQEAIRVYAEKWGTDAFKDKEFAAMYDDEVIKELVGSTVMGGFIGSAMKVSGITVDGVKNVAGFGPAKVQEVRDAKAIANTEQVSAVTVYQGHDASLTKIIEMEKMLDTDEMKAMTPETVKPEDVAFVREELVNGLEHLKMLGSATLDTQGEADKAVIIEKLASLRIFYKENMVGSSQKLNNRPIVQIQSDIDALPKYTETGATGLSPAKIMLLTELEVAKILVDPAFKEGVNTTSGNTSETNALSLKFHGGTFDGNTRIGMLQYVQLLTDPDITLEEQEAYVAKLENFLHTQGAKFTALDEAKTSWDAQAAEIDTQNPDTQIRKELKAKIEVKTGYRGDAGATELYYKGPQSEALHKRLEKENIVMQTIRNLVLGTSEETFTEENIDPVEPDVQPTTPDTSSITPSTPTTPDVAAGEVNTPSNVQTSTPKVEVNTSTPNTTTETIPDVQSFAAKVEGVDMSTEDVPQNLIDFYVEALVNGTATTMANNNPSIEQFATNYSTQIEAALKLKVPSSKDPVETPSNPIESETQTNDKITITSTEEEVTNPSQPENATKNNGSKKTNQGSRPKVAIKEEQPKGLTDTDIDEIDAQNPVSTEESEQLVTDMVALHLGKDASLVTELYKEIIALEKKLQQAEVELQNLVSVSKLERMKKNVAKHMTDLREAAEIDMKEINKKVRTIGTKIKLLEKNNKKSIKEKTYEGRKLIKERNDLKEKADKLIDKIDSKVDETIEEVEELDGNLQYTEPREAKIKEMQKDLKGMKKQQTLADTTGGLILKDMRQNPNRTKKDVKGSKENPHEGNRLEDHFIIKDTTNEMAKVHTILEEIVPEEAENAQTNKLLNLVQKHIKGLENSLREFVAGKLHGFAEAYTGVHPTGESYQSVSRMLISMREVKENLTDEYGKNQNVLNAETLTAISTVAMLEFSQGINEQQATQRTEDAVRGIRGMGTNDMVSPQDRAAIADFDGILGVTSEKMGVVMYKALGLKVKENTNEVTRERLATKLKTELGILGMFALEQQGLITLNTKSRISKSENANTISPEIQEKLDTKEFVVGYKIPSDVVYSDSTNIIANDISTFTITKQGHKVLDTKVKQGSQILEKLLQPQEESLGIYLEKGSNLTKNVKHQGVSGVVSDVYTEQEKAIAKGEAMERGISQPFIVLKEKLANLGLLNELAGYRNPDKVYIDDRAAARGKNNSIARSIDILDDVIEATEKGRKKFWLKMYVVTNGRFGIKGGKFDPMADKLHRGAHIFDETTITDEDAELETLFKIGFGQATGVKIDKQVFTASVKEADAKLAEMNEVLDKAETYDLAELDQAQIEELLEIAEIRPGSDTGHGMIGLVEGVRYLEWLSGEKEGDFKTSLTIETDAITSGYILKMLQLPIYMQVDVNGELVLDNDGKPMLDMEKVFSEVRKGGIIRIKEGEKTPTYGEIAQDIKERDAYQEPAQAFAKKLNRSMVYVYEDANTNQLVYWEHGEVKPYNEKLDWFDDNEMGDGRFQHKTVKEQEEFATKLAGAVRISMALVGEAQLDDKNDFNDISRNFMKQPFMVLNYGSSIHSIINEIAKTSMSSTSAAYPSSTNLNDLMVVVAGGGIKGKKALDTLEEAFLASMFYLPKTITKGNEFVNKFINKIRDEISNGRENKALDISIPIELRDSVTSMVANTVRGPISDTFQESYGELIKATKTLNDTVVLIGQLALPKLEAELIKATEEYNEGVESGKYMVPLPEAEVNATIRANKDMLPVLTLALSDGDANQMLLMDKGKGEWDLGNIQHDIQPEGSIKLSDQVNNVTIRSQFYKLLVAYTSGAVIPIHFLDGSLQSKVLAQHTALGVHDANFLALKNATEGTADYNKAVWELSKSWSMSVEFLESLHNTLNSMSRENIIAQDKRYFDTYANKAVHSNLKASKIEYGDYKKIKDGVKEHYTQIQNLFDTVEGDDFTTVGLLYAKKLTDEGTDINVAKAIGGLVLKLSKTPPNTVRSVYGQMTSLQNISEQGREKLFTENIYVEHAALEGAGVEYTDNTYTKLKPRTALKSEGKSNMKSTDQTSAVKIQESIIHDLEVLLKEIPQTPAKNLKTLIGKMNEGAC